MIENSRVSKIWRYGQFFKGYSENFKELAKIESWKEVEHCGYYYENGRLIGRDFIFPSKLFNRVADVLDLQKRMKYPNRVKTGHRSVSNLQFYVG